MNPEWLFVALVIGACAPLLAMPLMDLYRTAKEHLWR